MIGAIYWIIIGVAVLVIVIADRRSERLGAVEVPPHPLDFVRHPDVDAPAAGRGVDANLFS